MTNFPGTLPSATPALHGDVVGEQRAIAAAVAQAFGPYAASVWHSPEVGTTGSHAPAVGTAVARRIPMPPEQTITRLGEWVVTAAGAGGLRRLMIFSDTGGYPDALLKDSGTYDAAAAGAGTFQSTAAFAAITVGGPVWFVGVSQVAAPTVTGMTSQGFGMGLATVTGGNSQAAGYTMTGVTGAGPANWTATRAVTTSGPRIWFLP